ncbi:MAG: hypothetical protein KGZ25_10685, partial [Planctomycetes bacterium]|nr:hypothetical protein [Planctomycetota bacterium]
MNNKPLVGVWVDHRRALLFWSDEQANMDVQEIGSNYQEEGEPTDQVKIAGNNVHGGGVAHAHLDDRRREQLKHFYKELDKNLRPAEEIYIFGPGQAKKELA